MLYIYSKKSLLYKQVTKKLFFLSMGVVCLLMAFTYHYTTKLAREEVISNLTIEEKLVIVNNSEDSFTQTAFIDLLKDLNVKFPHIVLAQSIVETGHWTSNIFKENHNLFGMKQARIRVNTAKGTQYNHAYYHDWRESVYDYAFYQCRYLGGIRTEDEYFQYLSQSYAEAPDYVKILKGVIKKEKLEDKFK